MSSFNQNGKEYVEEIRKIEPTDPAHADVINALAQDIINNEAFLKKISEKHLDDMENPHNVTPAQIGAAAMYVQEVDLSNEEVYDVDIWYPVIGSSVIGSDVTADDYLLKKGYRRIKCNVTLNSGTCPPWSTHNSGFSCNLELLAVMGQWGSAVANTIVLDYTYSQCTDNPLGYTQITTSNNPVIYCRGGGKYYMYSEFPDQTWTPYTTEHGYGGMTVQPTSSCPGIFNTKKATLIADLDGNAATATKATQDGNGNVIVDTYVNKNNSQISAGKSVNVSVEKGIGLGYNVKVSGTYSLSFGFNSAARGGFSVSLGSNSYADGNNSITIGNSASADGNNAISLGGVTKAHGDFSTSLGYGASVSSSDTSVMQLGNNLSALRCNVALSVTSDIRDKIDINEITNATEFLNEINPFTYVSNARDLYSKEKLTDEEEENYKKYGFKPYDKAAHEQGIKKGERRRIGVSAQEVQEALTKVYGSADYANLVNNNLHNVNSSEIPEGVESHLTVTYESFIPFLIKAVQELSEKNKELHARIEMLENKNTF